MNMITTNNNYNLWYTWAVRFPNTEFERKEKNKRLIGLFKPPNKWEVEMASFAGTTQKCNTCEKKVYWVEQLTADNKVFHKSCFRCHHCKGTLKVYAIMQRMLNNTPLDVVFNNVFNNFFEHAFSCSLQHLHIFTLYACMAMMKSSKILKLSQTISWKLDPYGWCSWVTIVLLRVFYTVSLILINSLRWLAVWTKVLKVNSSYYIVIS